MQKFSKEEKYNFDSTQDIFLGANFTQEYC